MSRENMRRWQRWPSVKLGRWWSRKTGWHRSRMPGKRRQDILDDMSMRFAAQEAHDYYEAQRQRAAGRETSG